MNKHLIWAGAVVLIFAMICGTLVWINYNSWTLRFEMDDNTLEAVESMNLSETIPLINEKQYPYPCSYCENYTHLPEGLKVCLGECGGNNEEGGKE